MDLPAIVFFIVVPVVLLVVILEGRRQEKKHGKGSGKGQAMMRAGLLEVTNLLEPERKVEILREAESKADLLVQLDGKGEPPKP